MHLRLKWTLGIVLAIELAIAHAERPDVALDVPSCGAVPAFDGLRVYIKPGSADWGEFVLDRTGLRRLPRTQSLQIPGPNNRGMNGGPFWRNQFAPIGEHSIPGMTRGYPSAYSPNRKFFASAVFPRPEPRGSPFQIAISETVTSSATMIKTPLAVETLAWTPDGTMLAVIESRDDDSIRNFTGVWAVLYGTRLVYHDYWLSAYGIDGRVVCRTLVAPSVSETSIRIAWSEKSGSDSTFGQ